MRGPEDVGAALSQGVNLVSKYRYQISGIRNIVVIQLQKDFPDLTREQEGNFHLRTIRTKTYVKQTFVRKQASMSKTRPRGITKVRKKVQTVSLQGAYSCATPLFIKITRKFKSHISKGLKGNDQK